MGEALALDAAWFFAAFLVLLVLAAAGIAARRFLLERTGANVECGLRKDRGTWRLGVASYRLDELCWFGVFGISMRPEETFPRRDLAVVSRRPPTEDEISILGPDRIVVECQLGDAHPAGPSGSAGPPSGPPSVSGPPAGRFGRSRLGGAASAGAATTSASAPGGTLELALAESALTGLLAWLEAAPPGSHLGLAQ